MKIEPRHILLIILYVRNKINRKEFDKFSVKSSFFDELVGAGFCYIERNTLGKYEYIITDSGKKLAQSLLKDILKKGD